MKDIVREIRVSVIILENGRATCRFPIAHFQDDRACLQQAIDELENRNKENLLEVEIKTHNDHGYILQWQGGRCKSPGFSLLKTEKGLVVSRS